MHTFLQKLMTFLGSQGLAAVLFLGLLLLTFLGTIEQVNSGLFDVQKKYFESVFLVHWFGGKLPLPLPGVTLLLCLLTINLIVGGIIRMRTSKQTIGVLIVHIGILIMFAAALVKWQMSTDGHLTLWEGERDNKFQSYYDWEISVAQPGAMPASSVMPLTEFVIPGSRFQGLPPGESAVVPISELGIDVEISSYMRNSDIVPASRARPGATMDVDGFVLQSRELEKEAEQNIAGVAVRVTPTGGSGGTSGLLWGMERYPLSVDVNGKTVTLHLRHRTFELPFTVVLDDFIRELHPGTGMAAAFMSDITKVENGTEQKVRIQMNEPLRHEGYTLFQASWGPESARPGAPLFSTFAVVNNPSDQWPLISCIVIAIGMLIHFAQKLLRYQRAEIGRRIS